MRKLTFIVFILLANILLTACGTSNTDAPAKAVETYLGALVAKDADRLPTLVCGDWEDDALLELDSIQAVDAHLDNAVCQQTGTEGDTSLVNCTGSIVLTYDGEDQNIDLSTFTYQVVQEGGDWLVCGTR